jgi:hypothetical protein
MLPRVHVLNALLLGSSLAPLVFMVAALLYAPWTRLEERQPSKTPAEATVDAATRGAEEPEAPCYTAGRTAA